MELLQDRGDIAIEIADEHQGIAVLQLEKDVATERGFPDSLLIEISSQCREVSHDTGRAHPTLQELQLETEFGLQCLSEGKVWLDDGILAEGPFSVDIGLPEVGLRDRHATMLVSLPDDLSPVATMCIECATIIEDITFRHWAIYFPYIEAQSLSCVRCIYAYIILNTVISRSG